MDETTPPVPQPTPMLPEPEAPTSVEIPIAEEVAPAPTPPTLAPIEEALPSVVETAATPLEPTVTPPAESPPTVPEATPPMPTPTPVAAPALTLDEMLARLSPTELKALFKKYLFEIGAKGRAKTKAQFLEKQQKIIAHIGIHGRITHKEAMQLTNSAKTTATRLLQSLEKEGRVVQHGGYKARDTYYSLRL